MPVAKGPPARAVSGLLIGALTIAALGACSSLEVETNQPLKALASEDAETISEGGYRLGALASNGASEDTLVLLSFSGGGKRSSAFSYGVLDGLRAIPLGTGDGDRTLLDEVDVITAVSGGSFTAAYYGLHRDKIFQDYEADFLRQDINSFIYGIYLLPWNWDWLVNPVVGTNDYMQKVYDDLMFHGATYADLAARGQPIIALGSTDISYGTQFIFTQDNFDLICSDLEPFPVARAVAASNGFPVLFTPVTLTSYRDQCGDRRPGWERRMTETERRDPLSRVGFRARLYDNYLDAGKTKYVHLMDGGIVDNLAMRGVINAMLTLNEDIALLRDQRFPTIRRILIVSADGQASQDTSWARQRTVTGIGQLLSNVSGSQIDQYNFETLVLANDELERMVETLKRVRCASGPVVGGYACDDVVGRLVHLSLSNIPDPEVRARLQAIPTGLTLADDDVDALVEAGRNAVLSSDTVADWAKGLGTGRSIASN